LPTGEIRDAVEYRNGIPVSPERISQLIDMGNGGGTAILTDTRAVGQIVYEVSNDFRFWVLCNQDGRSGFVCPEPQTWMVDAPNQPFPSDMTGFDYIESHAEKTLKTRLRFKTL
jgi:galactose mutarotase-like enzyme